MRATCSVLILIVVATFGCGPGDGRQAVGGKVFINHKPLLNASISFRPVARDANTAGVAVKEGLFHIRADRGLPPGKYTVTVQAFQETGRTFNDPQRGKMPEYVPVVFQKIEPAEIEIISGRPNEFEIQLSTQKQ